jgi:sec-independent protein translocase protein TatA
MHTLLNILLLFDVSGGEILVIVLFALLFFGSKNIPDLMRGLGRGIREFKDATNSIQREIHESSEKVKQQINVPLDQQTDIIEKEFKEIEKEIKPLDQPDNTKP